MLVPPSNELSRGGFGGRKTLQDFSTREKTNLLHFLSFWRLRAEWYLSIVEEANEAAIKAGSLL